MRIVLADDHALVRQGVRALLERAGFDIAGEACDGQEALTLVAAVQPDIAVIDIGMPLLNGLEAARAIRGGSQKTRTILLTRHDEVQYVTQALRAGVKGYVLKSQAATDLVQAIQQVGSGKIYLSPNISRAVVEAYLNKSDLPPDPLTPRERQVLQMVGEGNSTKDVARILGISTKTPESHRARLMRKLDKGRRQDPRHQPQDGRVAPRQADEQARHPRDRQPGPLRDPSGTAGAVAPGSGLYPSSAAVIYRRLPQSFTRFISFARSMTSPDATCRYGGGGHAAVG